MAKLRGTIRHNDLEGGHYQLVTDDGTAYEVEGSDPLLAKEGARVEVDGQVEEDALSFAMTGPRLKVRSVKAI